MSSHYFVIKFIYESAWTQYPISYSNRSMVCWKQLSFWHYFFLKQKLASLRKTEGVPWKPEASTGGCTRIRGYDRTMTMSRPRTYCLKPRRLNRDVRFVVSADLCVYSSTDKTRLPSANVELTSFGATFIHNTREWCVINGSFLAKRLEEEAVYFLPFFSLHFAAIIWNSGPTVCMFCGCQIMFDLFWRTGV